jgi:hypothetical protein
MSFLFSRTSNYPPSNGICRHPRDTTLRPAEMVTCGALEAEEGEIIWRIVYFVAEHQTTLESDMTVSGTSCPGHRRHLAEQESVGQPAEISRPVRRLATEQQNTLESEKVKPGTFRPGQRQNLAEQVPVDWPAQKPLIPFGRYKVILFGQGMPSACTTLWYP